ncbi:hypothetical protein OAC85_02715, partial [Flavobacteriaceae bacterium]|nr:hypothetical protein [Flavobacteriaceae bacterium]
MVKLAPFRNIQVRITGMPSGAGNASFDIDFGTQICTLVRAVTNPVIINGVAVHRVISGEGTTGGAISYLHSTLVQSRGVLRSDLVS